ncbi:hypothetical protein U9M48_028904 [Paspalum notatum var. saurae]|uniref:Phytocyanin domain-containing protein n=1 Tax=Paspalum notatum var. saurae TaxID=547442 RepID=A0AAQ3X0N2_PASNO
MAGVAFVVVVCALFLLVCSAGSASASWHAQVFVVGGEPRGWRKPTEPTEETYNHWAARNRFHVGDFLHFKYDKNDSVLVVSADDYKFCGAANPLQQFDGGDTRIRLDRTGFCFFISGAPGHCDEGQRMSVRVLLAQQEGGGGKPGAAPARAPAAAAMPPGGDGDGGSYEDPGSGGYDKPAPRAGAGSSSGGSGTARPPPPPPPPHVVDAGADGKKTTSGAAGASPAALDAALLLLVSFALAAA